MTRRNLLKSLLCAPFLPLVWREKAEKPVAEQIKRLEPFEFLETGAVPFPLEGDTGTKFVRHFDDAYGQLREVGMNIHAGNGMTVHNLRGNQPNLNFTFDPPVRLEAGKRYEIWGENGVGRCREIGWPNP